jgi:hypothetical protein
MLEQLIEAGMNVARFNFSHGDHEGHKACLDRLRQAAKNKNRHVGEFNFALLSLHLQNMQHFFLTYICNLLKK